MAKSIAERAAELAVFDPEGAADLLIRHGRVDPQNDTARRLEVEIDARTMEHAARADRIERSRR